MESKSYNHAKSGYVIIICKYQVIKKINNKDNNYNITDRTKCY